MYQVTAEVNHSYIFTMSKATAKISVRHPRKCYDDINILLAVEMCFLRYDIPRCLICRFFYQRYDKLNLYGLFCWSITRLQNLHVLLY